MYCQFHQPTVLLLWSHAIVHCVFTWRRVDCGNLKKLPVLSWQKRSWEGKRLCNCLALFLQQWTIVGSPHGITIMGDFSQVISDQWVSEASHKTSMAYNENHLFTLLESCNIFGMLGCILSFSPLFQSFKCFSPLYDPNDLRFQTFSNFSSLPHSICAAGSSTLPWKI